MPDVELKIRAIINQVLQTKGESNPVTLEMSLHENGLGFDSLDTATLSALLEQEFGKDPYSQGVFPRTIMELIEFYKAIE
jgi:acyl carrier protein